jgi:hypothetical protein
VGREELAQVAVALAATAAARWATATAGTEVLVEAERVTVPPEVQAEMAAMPQVATVMAATAGLAGVAGMVMILPSSLA